jgi:hypothetical protein
MRSLLPIVLLVPACIVGVGDAPEGMGSGSNETPQAPEQPTTPLIESVAGGAFAPIAPYTNIAGKALLVRRLDGKTDVSIAVSGVGMNVAYTAHVHAAPCQFAGGGHYKIDPAVADVLEANELWVKGMSNPVGVLATDASFPHVARGEALSVVIHDPMGGGKMACADLVADEATTLEFSGTLKAFAAATAADMQIAGTIDVTRTGNSTSFKLDVTGLDKAALAYGSHIHAEPCEVATGGGHYKLDPLVVDTLETNEIWLPITGYATAGTATAMVAAPTGVRSDAQSIVIHRTITVTPPNIPKVACANLTRKTARLPLETTGTAVPLAGANGASLTGSAIMTRKLTGVTEVAVVMTGLTANTKYQAHVHNQPCAVESGGGHYKLDRNVQEALATNELWFELTADAKGAAHDSMWVDKIAAADAQSLVVHSESARMACFDLQ